MKRSARASMWFCLGVVLLTSPLIGHLADAATMNPACGDPFHNNYGPFDYRTASTQTKYTVEHFHFTPKVASLKGGESTVVIGADIAYTLRAFPNHPRALMAMAELARREKTPMPVGAGFPISCWYERAIEFRPDDGVVRTIIGIELLKDGKASDAIEQLEKARALNPGDANVPYNLGLAYFDLGDYDKSLKYAKEAYKAGFPLPGLRHKLQKMHKWQ